MPNIITLDLSTFDRNSSLPIFLFTLSHPSLDNDILFCSDNMERLPDLDNYGNPIYGVTSQGKFYYYIPLQITIPSQNAEQTENGAIVISNVRRALVPFVRQTQIRDGYAKLKIEIIEYDGTIESKDIVLRTIAGINITNIEYNNLSMSFSMDMNDFSGEPFPSARFVPSYFPALFKAL